METVKESLSCKEFHRGQFLLEVGAESDGAACVTMHCSFGPLMESGVLETYFQIPKRNWKKRSRSVGPNRWTVKPDLRFCVGHTWSPRYNLRKWRTPFGAFILVYWLLLPRTSAHTFVSGLRRVERGLPLHIPTEFELLCFNKAVFITSWLCSSSSLYSFSHPETLQQLDTSRERA